MRSYSSQLLEENLVPPILHPMQLSAEPAAPALSSCSALVRLWMNHAPGSEAFALVTLRSNIDILMAEVGSDSKDITITVSSQLTHPLEAINQRVSPTMLNPGPPRLLANGILRSNQRYRHSERKGYRHAPGTRLLLRQTRTYLPSRDHPDPSSLGILDRGLGKTTYAADHIPSYLSLQCVEEHAKLCI